MLIEFAYDDEGHLVPMSFITPEDRVACREEQAEGLRAMGLTEVEITLFIIYATSPSQEIES